METKNTKLLKCWKNTELQQAKSLEPRVVGRILGLSDTTDAAVYVRNANLRSFRIEFHNREGRGLSGQNAFSEKLISSKPEDR